MNLGIFCPGSPPRQEALNAGRAWLRAHGFETILAPHLRTGEGLHAGAPEERAADLHALFLDPAVDAVICARGGSGSMGILPLIDPAIAREHGKPVIGMSDATALHLALYRLCGLPGISGRMVVQLSAETPAYTGSSWLRLTRGPCPPGPVPLPADTELELLSRGRGNEERGVLFPCNFSLLSSLIGTPYLPSLRGAILVLEDVHETPQSLDRMTSQLSLSGAVEGIAGLVLGRFTECTPRGPGVREEEGRLLLRNWARSLAVPALAGFPYGHEEISATLPFGSPARVQVDPPGLILLAPCGLGTPVGGSEPAGERA